MRLHPSNSLCTVRRLNRSSQPGKHQRSLRIRHQRNKKFTSFHVKTPVWQRSRITSVGERKQHQHCPTLRPLWLDQRKIRQNWQPIFPEDLCVPVHCHLCNIITGERLTCTEMSASIAGSVSACSTLPQESSHTKVWAEYGTSEDGSSHMG